MGNAGITTKFTYLHWQDLYKEEKVFLHLTNDTISEHDGRKTNTAFHQGLDETVHDVREAQPAGHEFTLDGHGFMYCKSSSQLERQQFFDKSMVEQVHFRELEEAARKYMDGVDEIIFYNWRLRNSDIQSDNLKPVNYEDPTAQLGYANTVHIDHSPNSIAERVYRVSPDRAEYLLKGRVRMITFWHPINGPVQEWPLAVSDGRTVPASRLIECQRIRPTSRGNTVYVLFGEETMWYYMSAQDNEDVVLFKSYDSDIQKTCYSAHSAFRIGSSTQTSKSRESIEVRAFVFTHSKD